MASCSPVDAPDGTAARPSAPEARRTSTSTVGLPRESMISRAVMAVMVVFMKIRSCSKGLRTCEVKRKRAVVHFCDQEPSEPNIEQKAAKETKEARKVGFLRYLRYLLFR